MWKALSAIQLALLWPLLLLLTRDSVPLHMNSVLGLTLKANSKIGRAKLGRLHVTAIQTVNWVSLSKQTARRRPI